MDFENEKPAYAAMPIKEAEVRELRFESDTRQFAFKEFAEHGMRAVGAWSDDPKGHVKIDEQGNLRFLARPGYSVFAAVKSA